MPPAKTPPVKSGLDLEQIIKMQEPLTVYVMRLRGSSKETIPLPVKEGHEASGVGWTIEDVKNLSSVLIPVCGGGSFEAQISDATQPEPITHKWTFVLPSESYPAKPPSTLNPIGTVSEAYPMTGAPMPPSQPLNGFIPSGFGQQQPVNYGASSPIYGGGAYAGAYPGPQFNQPQQPVNPWWLQQQQQQTRPAAPALDAATQLREELHKQQLAAQELRHRHEREIEQIRTAAAAASAAPKTDERYEREREARERAEREAVEARARADQAARESALRSEREEQRRQDAAALQRLEAAMAEDRRRSDEKFSQLMAQIAQQAAVAAAAPRGPDPMLMMMFEAQKSQADAARETARIAADSARETARLNADVEKESARAQVESARIAAEGQQRMITELRNVMAPAMVSPAEMARMVREAGQTGEQMTRTMFTNVSELLGMQREFTSSMLQMAPQGEGVAGRVVGAIENAVQTYSQNQAQVETARINAMKTQAQAQMQAQQAMWQTPPPVAPTGAAAPQPQPPQAVVTPPPVYVPDANATTPGGALAGPSTEPVRSGKTDEQWFGPALGDVMNLRNGVTLYLKTLEGGEVTLAQPPGEPINIVDDKTQKPIGVSPLMAARFLLIAANEVRTKNIPGIEAMTYFFEQEMYHAFMEVTLPDAPPEYRADVLRFLHRLLKGESIVQENDEPMFGIADFLDDDGAPDGDEVTADAPAPAEPEMVIPPPAVRQPIPVAARAHRQPNGRGR